MDFRPSPNCLLQPKPDTRLFQPQAEDILSDEELLELFRIIKQIIRRRPDAERMAKVVFCIFYSLGDHVKCYRPAHDDTIIFRDDLTPGAVLNAVRVSHNPSCCDISPAPPPVQSQNQQQQQQQPTTSSTEEQTYTMGQRWKDMDSNNGTDTSYPKPLSVSYLTSSSPKPPSAAVAPPVGSTSATNDTLTTDLHSSDMQLHRHEMHPSLRNAPSLPSTVTGSTLNTPPSFLSHSPINHSSTPSALMLLDHTPQTTTNDVIVNSDPDTAVRPYSHFRPLYSMNPTSSASARFDEHHGTPPMDYTQQQHHPLQSIRPSLSASSPASPASMSPAATSNITVPTSINSGNSGNGSLARYQQLNSMLHGPMTNTRIQPDPATDQIVMEPKQRGFYYQYGRIDREPPLLRRFAEQGVLTQASLLRKRKRQCSDTENPYVLSTLPAPAKKPKIPHRHGEFEQRRKYLIMAIPSVTNTALVSV